MSENYNPKLDMLDKISDGRLKDINFNLIQEFASDPDVEVRSRTAEILANYPIKKAEMILQQLLNDSDELVRSNACDSLYFSKSEEILTNLKVLAKKDKSMLVRGYALLSALDIYKNIGPMNGNFKLFVYDLLKSERSTWVKVLIYKALYILGDREVLTKILIETSSRNYRVRYIAIKTLKELLNDENKRLIFDTLTNRAMKENTRCVKLKIAEILKETI